MRTARLLAVIAFTLSVSGQEANQGTITGFVYDQSQAIVPNAEVTVVSRATGQARGVRVDDSDVYTVVALQPGVYDVKASARLRENLQYQRTEVTMIAGSNCRFRNSDGRQDFIATPYQIRTCNTSARRC